MACQYQFDSIVGFAFADKGLRSVFHGTLCSSV